MAKNNGAVAPKTPHKYGRVAKPKRSRRRHFFDRRTTSARRWQALFAEYFSAAGQKHAQLCATAASLAVERERLDHALARGEFVDVDHLVRLSGTLARVLGKLGLTKPAHQNKLDRLIAAVREAHS
jgi:hypothetical protein